ncbi:hypothetical protein EI94DRAFT_1704459 [Lactarius quietus]|nr:hypothetical protein EI94DRAFT_1704459 [Lactarius quietus]
MHVSVALPFCNVVWGQVTVLVPNDQAPLMYTWNVALKMGIGLLQNLEHPHVVVRRHQSNDKNETREQYNNKEKSQEAQADQEPRARSHSGTVTWCQRRCRIQRFQPQSFQFNSIHWDSPGFSLKLHP